LGFDCLKLCLEELLQVLNFSQQRVNIAQQFIHGAGLT
jgi:hypothetical protein